MFTKNLKITKISKKPFKGKVYNFSVEEDESYFANGICSHNCRGIWVAIHKEELEKPPVTDIPKYLRERVGTLSEFRQISKARPLAGSLADDFLKGKV